MWKWSEHRPAITQNVLAIGETGLDKAVNVPYDLQLQAFEEQLAHCRIHQQTHDHPLCKVVQRNAGFPEKIGPQSIPWIFHWFNADEQIARELIRKNCYLSFGHMLFKEQSKAFQVFQDIRHRSYFS